ncbi:MAG: ABC transporter substrate-binding protein [Actinomycetaceae bacterium]|nr:ABC transporter substrate-binding protein [Arcanobacterium sp.]MDD7687508.1 ABC transporter substrate-binding protein [Actinomycetaceae bacterium]MDY5272983.1 ABC transporter substrate-binding protein [Arcanobacterium sp.]
MRSMKRWAKASAVLAAAALALSACGGGSGQKKAENPSAATATGNLKVFAAYDTTNWNPSNTSSALAVGANLQVVEGLYEFDFSSFKAHKALAAADEPTKVDDTTYEVKLRDGAKFSTGDAVTAEDVVSSYKRIVDGDKDSAGTVQPSSYAAFLTSIKSIEAKDDSTVTVKLDHAIDNLKERLALIKVVPTKATFDELTKMPVGSGPYKYDKITDTAQELSVNEHYTGPNPATVATIHYDNSRDATARLTAALGGTTDVVEALDPAGIEQVKKAGWKVDEATAYGIAMMTFNTTKAPFNDKRVRQALLTAIDSQTMIKTALNGAGQEPTSFLPDYNDQYKKAATQFTYNVDAAKKLLADAGVAAGTEIRVMTTTDTWIAAMGPQIQQNFEALGLKVNLSQVASGDLWNNNVAQGNFDVVVAPGDASVYGADPGVLIKGWFYSELWMKDRFRLTESDPKAAADLVALMDEADKATGDAAKAKWGEVQDMIADQAALYPLAFHTLYTAYNPAKVSNLTPIGVTGLQLIGAKVTE